MVLDQHVVHGDLKPATFPMVKKELKLIDFGIAKRNRPLTRTRTRALNRHFAKWVAQEFLARTTGAYLDARSVSWPSNLCIHNGTSQSVFSIYSD